MEKANKQDKYYLVIIGRNADDLKQDVLMGIGPEINQEKNETERILFRVQREQNDPNPIRGVFSIPECLTLLQTLTELIENAKDIRKTNIIKKLKKNRKSPG